MAKKAYVSFDNYFFYYFFGFIPVRGPD